MPELPDLAVFAENLEARLQGRTVLSIECHPATRLHTSPAQLRDALCNHSIASIRRVGKEMAFVFSSQATLLVHLMLKGKFIIATDPQAVKSRVLTLGLSDRLGLCTRRKSRTSPEMASGVRCLICSMASVNTLLIAINNSSITRSDILPIMDFGEILACQRISST